MLKKDPKKKVVFVSTYPPRGCGLATYTQDLVQELNNMRGFSEPKIIALSDDDYAYDKEVSAEINQFERASYLKAACGLKRSAVDMVVIQHEYGIFGGEYGEYILDFVNNLEIPVITVVHTVLANPLAKQRFILHALGKASAKIVTMARNTVKPLVNTYGIAEKKIKVIPHGVPVYNLVSREKLKKQWGYEGRQIISTFGLIAAGKGLEYGIEALAKVAVRHPNVQYLILGQTHPTVKKKHGESYRKSLEELVEKKGLRQNVQFINKYLTKEEIIRYLQLTDIYLTPYIGREQAVSGALAYAVGYGKAIVSTPYSYAREMLAGGRGLLADFENPDSLAFCLLKLLDDPELKKEMEKRTAKFGKTMFWPNVAREYAGLLIEEIDNYKKYHQEVI